MIVLVCVLVGSVGLFVWAALRTSADADRRAREMYEMHVREQAVERAKRRHPSNRWLYAVEDDHGEA